MILLEVKCHSEQVMWNRNFRNIPNGNFGDATSNQPAHSLLTFTKTAWYKSLLVTNTHTHTHNWLIKWFHFPIRLLFNKNKKHGKHLYNGLNYKTFLFFYKQDARCVIKQKVNCRPWNSSCNTTSLLDFKSSTFDFIKSRARITKRGFMVPMENVW